MNQVVMQLVHHQPEVSPALLEGGPIEFTQQTIMYFYCLISAVFAFCVCLASFVFICMSVIQTSRLCDRSLAYM